MRKSWQRCGRILFLVLLVCFLLFLGTSAGGAQPLPLPDVTVDFPEQEENPQDLALVLQILLLLTVLSLAPAIMIMITSFTRIVVVLSFIRNAMATQNTPPNQVIVALALFLTFFTMAPYWQEASELALQPYLAQEIGYEEALEVGVEPLREFMFRQTRERDLSLFVAFADIPRPEDPDGIPTYVLIPAFMISELQTAFQIGFLIYVPFLVIDMVVASTLMSMGMLMLPPVMISLPFKVLLFVLVDGWHLVVRSLVQSFG